MAISAPATAPQQRHFRHCYCCSAPIQQERSHSRLTVVRERLTVVAFYAVGREETRNERASAAGAG
ncbi:uncharacterized protein MICPUCDRAFT_54884 [Micromonas pusilla CCMP1545]|uniref:Predicted protein n=1 Tax=Micromonas pusilla (strain CCMP1545) TaxID=564608 RepID=C1NAF6_MICPC|nr:uncharacterized protein MICPUCDRAFT_54884 [Micromonas pusilla CCMP1545]EEH50878.1 predicted protein [Micromonas pusilla CCMP1545]|eukprot:XP_003064898.1 predicted protein [Micromonas pusilla CCMP1545]